MFFRSASLVIVVPFLAVSASEMALTLIQASARSHNAGIAEAPNPATPLMYVAEGCDGSTAAMGHITEILALHGLDGSYERLGGEFLCPGSNPFYAESGNNMVRAMKLLYDNLRAQHKTLVTKSILHRDMDMTTKNRVLLDMGTLAVYVTRKNMLDQLVCMIRDCFLNTATQSTVVGYPVNSAGNPSEMCFSRRKSDVVEKAWLKVSRTYPNGRIRSFLQEALVKLQTNVDTGYDALKKAGYNITKIDSEDILAFEAGGEMNIQTSVTAWTQLLQAWGIVAKIPQLTQYLKSKASTYSKGSQRTSIYNYDEVAAELKRLGLQSMLRD